MGFFGTRIVLSYRDQKEKIKNLLQNNVSLLAYHLPLDAHSLYGNNWRAATEMGWYDLEPFCSLNGVCIGVKGYVKSQSRHEFQKKLEDYYQHPAHTVFGGKEIIETAGLVSGGAYRQISDAVHAGVDAFITGNFDEPVWHQAWKTDEFFCFRSFRYRKNWPRALGEHLSEQFDLDVNFIDIANPF